MPKQLAFDGTIVKKHNEFIRSKITISNTNALRIFACLISQIKTSDTKLKDEYSIDIKTVLPEEAGGFSYQLIKDACRELKNANTEVDDEEKKEFEISGLINRISYKKGFITAKFNPDMSKLLIGLKTHFTQYSLIEYCLLPSVYSKKIFEIIKSWQDKPEFTISLDKLHFYLDVPKSFEQRYPDFRRNVLERAYEDIHELTSLKYEWEAVYRGRRVDAIRFVLSTPRIKQVDTKKEKIEQNKTSENNNKIFLMATECHENNGKKKTCSKADDSAKCKYCKNFLMSFGR